MLPWSIKVTGLGSKNLVVSSSFLVLLRISNDVEMELVKSIHPLDNVFKIREFFKLAGIEGRIAELEIACSNREEHIAKESKILVREQREMYLLKELLALRES